jgi:hypothetical protein
LIRIRVEKGGKDAVSFGYLISFWAPSANARLVRALWRCVIYANGERSGGMKFAEGQYLNADGEDANGGGDCRWRGRQLRQSNYR